MKDTTAGSTPEITITEFLTSSPRELELEVLAGASSAGSRTLTTERLQKLGLALTGFIDYLRPGRVKIVGRSEISYLSRKSSDEQQAVFAGIDPDLVPCILVTTGLEIPGGLVAYAEANLIPLLRTRLVSSRAVNLVTSYLHERLAPQITLHGVFMGIFGVGVLIVGDSGIGKSECALDLITRGHRLISDDSVIIKRLGDQLIGDSPELTCGHIEIRGLGIISVTDLFGVSAVGKKNRIELCIELKAWNSIEEIERLGLEMESKDIFGVHIASFVFPVSPARNLSTLVETAVKIFLLKRSGVDAAQELIRRHTAALSNTH